MSSYQSLSWCPKKEKHPRRVYRVVKFRLDSTPKQSTHGKIGWCFRIITIPKNQRMPPWTPWQSMVGRAIEVVHFKGKMLVFMGCTSIQTVLGFMGCEAVQGYSNSVLKILIPSLKLTAGSAHESMGRAAKRKDRTCQWTNFEGQSVSFREGSLVLGRGWATQSIPSKCWSSTWKMARQEADSSCAVCVPTSQPTVVVQVGKRGIFVVLGAVQPFRSQWLKNYPTFWKSMVGRWSIFLSNFGLFSASNC